MSIPGPGLPPSSSLPRLRSLHSVTAAQLKTGLDNLQAIYCPLRLPTDLAKPKEAISAAVDSGYASEDEFDEQGQRDIGDVLSVFRLDEFERSFVVRWLTSLIARADELPFGEEMQSSIIDEASFILSSFSDSGCEDDDEALYRSFSFPVRSSHVPGDTVNVRLKDAPLSGIDHTDVGLQSWGAGIVFSNLLCAQPERFLSHLPPEATLIELGAGTGLISLTLSKLLPLLLAPNLTLVATDYHPAVIENLRANIAASTDSIPVQTATLDWTTPPAPLQSSVDMLFAADAVYAPEHASLLRDCAAHLLRPGGSFWLVVTVRSSGKFDGIVDTVESAFKESDLPHRPDGLTLRILEKEMLHKQRGVGRGDESDYVLFRIGWTSL